jgi:hypothetical protein
VRLALTPLAIALILACLTGMAPDSTAPDACGPCFRATEGLRTVVERETSGDSLVSENWLFLATHLETSSRVCAMAQAGRFHNRDYIVCFDSLFLGLLSELHREPDHAIAMKPIDDATAIYEMLAVARVRAELHIQRDFRTVFAQIGCPDSADWRLIQTEGVEPAIDATFERVLSTHPELGVAHIAIVDFAKQYVGEMREIVLGDCWGNQSSPARHGPPESISGVDGEGE